MLILPESTEKDKEIAVMLASRVSNCSAVHRREYGESPNLVITISGDSFYDVLRACDTLQSYTGDYSLESSPDGKCVIKIPFQFISR